MFHKTESFPNTQMIQNRQHVPARTIQRGIGLAILAVLIFATTIFGQTTATETDLRQVESELEEIKTKLEEKTENLEKLTEKEQQATVKSRSIREEMELLEEVRNRLNKKYHTLNKELSTTQQYVRRLEETYQFRQEVLARTITSAYTTKAVSDATELGNHGSGADRRQYFARLVSLAQVDRIQQAADSMAVRPRKKRRKKKPRSGSWPSLSGRPLAIASSGSRNWTTTRKYIAKRGSYRN